MIKQILVVDEILDWKLYNIFNFVAKSGCNSEIKMMIFIKI